MHKLILSLLCAAPLWAQTYSRWNYSDAVPLNTVADNELVAFYTEAISNHAEGDLYVHVSYTYPAATDSSFELPDLGDNIIRVFDPTPAPDGATPLERENTVVVLSKHSPLKSKTLIGGDGILPKGQTIRPLNTYLAWAARKEAQALRKAVDDAQKVDKRLKRKDAWLKVKADKKAEKEAKQNANKLGKK